MFDFMTAAECIRKFPRGEMGEFGLIGFLFYVIFYSFYSQNVC